MDIDLSGRVALVTGAGRNIGRAIAENLAGAGAQVAITYRDDDKSAKEAVESIRRLGGVAVARAMALEDERSVGEGVEWARDALGEVDILVNNAGIRPQALIGEIATAEWDHVFAVNVRGPFLLANALVPGMRQRGWGRVIGLGGMHAYTGHRGRAHVLSSKLAMVGLTRAIAFETAGTGVTANVVVPGVIDTDRGDPNLYGPQTDRSAAAKTVLVNRLGTPEEVADMCLFLASDRAGYITGQEIFVTGGAYPMAPAH